MEEWKSMSSEEVTRQYSPSRWSHRMGPDDVIAAHVKVLTEESEASKRNVECHMNIPYGLSAKEKLDIFAGDTLPGEAPVFVYIHGGYWQFLSREIGSFCVPPLAKAGAVVVALGYNIAPDADMETILSEVQRGVSYVLGYARSRKSRGVYLCGHSAGGHLAAMMLGVDWLKEHMHSDADIKGALLVSGVYDLRPLVPTYVNDPLKMTQESAWQCSPMNHVDSICQHSKSRRIIVAEGEHDSPEFRRQSQQFEQILKSRGLNSRLVDVPGTDHFDVVEKLRDEDFILTKEAIKLMALDLGALEMDLGNTKVS